MYNSYVKKYRQQLHFNIGIEKDAHVIHFYGQDVDSGALVVAVKSFPRCREYNIRKTTDAALWQLYHSGDSLTKNSWSNSDSQSNKETMNANWRT